MRALVGDREALHKCCSRSDSNLKDMDVFTTDALFCQVFQPQLVKWDYKTRKLILYFYRVSTRGGYEGAEQPVMRGVDKDYIAP